MKKFEATTLEEACELASKDFNCSIEELEYNIVQYPKKGFFGLFAKKAVIVATPKKITTDSKQEQQNDKSEKNVSLESEIVDSFFSQENTKNVQNKSYEQIDAKSLEKIIKNLMDKSCFNIDTVEVDIENNTAFVFIDGEDAALLIGKEGYRYNALSYILFNLVNSKYGLYLKLEIAQFLASQKEMIKNFLKPIIEQVKKEGKAKTKPLDGILVQIALEYLREEFPNKYVAIKKDLNNQRYIVINDFKTNG
jgi:spoIIIJ-associated protein